MPTPPKPFTVLRAEGKSHRTKAELEQRRQAEEALATGKKMKERDEVRSNPIAHKEFVRLNKLYKNIEKNDALFEGVINRYCMLYAECKEFEEKREKFYETTVELRASREQLIANEDMTLSEYFKTLNSLESQLVSMDKQVQAKRKMMLDIEKENIMTVASGLRNIPKKESSNTEDKLKAFLNG